MVHTCPDAVGQFEKVGSSQHDKGSVGTEIENREPIKSTNNQVKKSKVDTEETLTKKIGVQPSRSVLNKLLQQICVLQKLECMEILKENLLQHKIKCQDRVEWRI